ncbi:MAG: asparagine synthase-related protein, partial [Steroidobacteraceae bacterium]
RPLSRKELAYEHHPLLSQPIVEHCLKTPTYVHLRGGRHRALARDAFSDCVPQQIIQRESKGDTTAFVVESIRRSEDFLCELLLDGVLVRERLINRAQLEACLRDGQALMPGQLPPLLASIAAEIWARAWSSGATHV